MRNNINVKPPGSKKTYHCEKEPKDNHFYIHSPKQETGKQEINNRIAKSHVNWSGCYNFCKRRENCSIKLVIHASAQGGFRSKIGDPPYPKKNMPPNTEVPFIRKYQAVDVHMSVWKNAGLKN